MQTNKLHKNRSRSLYDLIHSFLRVVFAINIILAIFQAATILQQKPFFQELEINPRLIIWLLLTALIKLIFHSLAFISFGQKLKKLRLWFAWLAIGINIATYWYDYFFLWHADQRLQPPFFTLGLHVLIVVLLLYYTIQKQKWESTDGSGN